ncbi:MAG: transporter [Deltaproteobacteria bacterium]|nr:transporter [Deltaproteobacteria bacterium]
MTTRFKKIWMIVLAVSLLSATVVSADDSFDGVPLPSGTLGMLFYFDQTAGNKLYSSGDKLSDDFNLTADVGIWRSVYYYNIGPFAASTNLVLPFGTISVDGAAVGNANISSSGMGDPLVCQTLWPINDPENLTWACLATWVTMPYGQYDNDKLVNIGSNRWAIKPGFSMTKGIGSKGTFLEVYANGEFYTKNDEYGAGEVDMEQDPLYTFETHLIQHLSRETFVSLDYFYHAGGETKVASIKQGDEQKDHALQFTLAHMITEKTHLMLKYKSDLKVENGPKTNTFGVRIAYLIPLCK